MATTTALEKRGEKDISSTGRPNVEALMAGIREKVRASLAEDKNSYPRFTPTSVSQASMDTALIDYDELNFMNAHWHDWSVAEEITSHRPLIGRFIVKAKRFVIDALLNHVLKGYFERERQFHMQLVRYLNANARYVDNRDYRNFWQLAQKVDNDVAAMNKRVDHLFDTAFSSMQALELKLERVLEKLAEKDEKIS